MVNFPTIWVVLRVECIDNMYFTHGSYVVYMTRWWFQTFFRFSPLPGEMFQFDLRIFFRWVVQPPARCVCSKAVDLLDASILPVAPPVPSESCLG